jgi:hypothetical protein
MIGASPSNGTALASVRYVPRFFISSKAQEMISLKLAQWREI